MNTIILPGFSDSNKAWLLECQDYLNKHGILSSFFEWKHWKTKDNSDFVPDDEAELIIKSIGNEKVNLIAKSLGTLVAMKTISKIGDQINKIILCGIPLHDLEVGDSDNYLTLKQLNNVTVFQNKNDNHGTYDEVKEFISSFNANIEVIEKDREDHNYPFYEDFLNVIALQK